MIRKNRLKEKLSQGKPVVGSFCNLPSPHVVEIAGLAGMDFIIVDAEHTTVTPLFAEGMYRAAEVTNITPITRIGENNQQVIQKFLDAGSMGVQIPLVNTKEEAQRVVDAVKYPPIGKRGLAGTRASWYGMGEPMGEYVQTANRETLVIVQAETLDALRNVKSLSEVEGVDMVFMGPSDISSSMGLHGQIRHPEVLEAIEEAGKVVNAAGKATGTISRNEEEHVYWLERGFQYLCSNVGALLGQASGRYVKEFRSHENRLNITK